MNKEQVADANRKLRRLKTIKLAHKRLELREVNIQRIEDDNDSILSAHLKRINKIT